MNDAAYAHSRLEPDHIRILHLAPGAFADAIVCSLHHVNHRSKPHYEALSYVWGDEDDEKRGISVHGPLFLITPSLELALRHLRHATHERVLWIDHICINQANNEEKTEQIKLMGDIYRNAADVLVWLGDRTLVSTASGIFDEITPDECKRLFELISILSIDKHLDHLQCYEMSKDNRLQPIQEFLSAFDTLRKLMRLPWWTRTWTVQEILLARNASVFIGAQWISWKDLEAAAFNIGKHRDKCCSWAYNTLTEEIGTALDQFYLPIKDLGIRRKRQSDTGYIPDLILDLQQFRHRHSRDPLDKVYGILGLHAHRRHIAAYNRTLVDVYVDVMMETIAKENDLRALVNENTRDQHNADLPSWVIDWRTSTDNTRFLNRFFRYFEYCASKDSTASAKLVQSSTLQLRGFQVDNISSIEYLEAFTKGTDVYVALDKLLEHLRRSFSSEDIYMSGCTYVEALRRTTLGNRIWESSEDLIGYRRIVENDFRLYTDFYSERRAWNHEDPFDRIAQTLVYSLYERAFFLTTQGYIGIGPPTTKVGDNICIFLGGKVPFVTRSVPGSRHIEHWDGLTPSTLHYELVGDCYVHGIQEGEAMDQVGRQIVPILLY